MSLASRMKRETGTIEPEPGDMLDAGYRKFLVAVMAGAFENLFDPILVDLTERRPVVTNSQTYRESYYWIFDDSDDPIGYRALCWWLGQTPDDARALARRIDREREKTIQWIASRESWRIERKVIRQRHRASFALAMYHMKVKNQTFAERITEIADKPRINPDVRDNPRRKAPKAASKAFSSPVAAFCGPEPTPDMAQAVLTDFEAVSQQAEQA